MVGLSVMRLVQRSVRGGGFFVLGILGAVGVTQAAPLDVADVDAVVLKVEAAQSEATRSEATRSEATRQLRVADDLFAGETLRTGKGARLHATLSDGGKLMLGEDAIIALDSFLLDADEPRGALRVTKGAFRMISGRINKTRGGTLTMVTPVATIGVRGTDFWGFQTEDSLKMALLDDGELSITFPTGTVVLTQPMTLVTFVRGAGIPVIEVLTPEALAGAAATVSLPE